MGMFQMWGLGAELIFKSDLAVKSMRRAFRAVGVLRGGLDGLSRAGALASRGLQSLGMALLPIGAGLGFAAARGSELAAGLEANTLAMRVLVGDLGKADKLLGMIRANAAATPFQEGDLIDGSKRLLRLTGSNIDANMELLKLSETMAALDPTKSVTDAVEAVLDAASGGGFERLKEFGVPLRAEQFKNAGATGGAEYGKAVTDEIARVFAERTGGADVVGLLSESFTGRKSTLIDAVDGILRELGSRINDRLKPAFVGLTDFLNDELKPVMIDAFDSAFTTLDAIWHSVGEPVVAAMLAAWRALGPGAQASLVAGVGVVVSLAAAAAGAAGALAVVGLALQGLLFIGGAVVTAVGSVMGLLLAPEILVGLLAVGAAVGILSGAFATLVALAGPQALGLLKDGAAGALGSVVRWLVLGQAAAASFVQWIKIGLAPAWEEAGAKIGPPIRDLLGLLGDLWRSMTRGIFTTRDMSIAFSLIGFAAGKIAGAALGGFVDVTMFLVTAMTQLLHIMIPVLDWFGRLQIAALGAATGTLSIGEAMQLMASTSISALLQLVRVFATETLRSVAFVVDGLSGAFGPQFARLGLADPFADASASLTVGSALLDSRLGDSIRKAEIVAEALERTRAKRAGGVDVTVQAPEVHIEVPIEVPVVIDDAEVARAGGRAAVRSSERGIGPRLSPAHRGRVLRSGLIVTPLSPAEV